MIPVNMDSQHNHRRENQSNSRHSKSSRQLGELELLLFDGEAGFLEMRLANGTRFGLLLTPCKSGP